MEKTPQIDNVDSQIDNLNELKESELLTTIKSLMGDELKDPVRWIYIDRHGNIHIEQNISSVIKKLAKLGKLKEKTLINLVVKAAQAAIIQAQSSDLDTRPEIKNDKEDARVKALAIVEAVSTASISEFDPNDIPINLKDKFAIKFNKLKFAVIVTITTVVTWLILSTHQSPNNPNDVDIPINDNLGNPTEIVINPTNTLSPTPPQTFTTTPGPSDGDESGSRPRTQLPTNEVTIKPDQTPNSQTNQEPPITQTAVPSVAPVTPIPNNEITLTIPSLTSSPANAVVAQPTLSALKSPVPSPTLSTIMATLTPSTSPTANAVTQEVATEELTIIIEEENEIGLNYPDSQAMGETILNDPYIEGLREQIIRVPLISNIINLDPSRFSRLLINGELNGEISIIGDSQSTISGGFLNGSLIDLLNSGEFLRNINEVMGWGAEELIDAARMFSEGIRLNNQQGHRAAFVGANTSSMLDPFWASQMSGCNTNETIIACETRRHESGLVLIMLGTGDKKNLETTPTIFEDNMRQIINSTINSGSMPVLQTIPLNPSVINALEYRRGLEYNAILINLSEEFEIPIINFFRQTQSMENYGVGSDGQHFSFPSVGGFWSTDSIAYSGVTRNFSILGFFGDLKFHVDNYYLNVTDINPTETPLPEYDDLAFEGIFNINELKEVTEDTEVIIRNRMRMLLYAVNSLPDVDQNYPNLNISPIEVKQFLQDLINNTIDIDSLDISLLVGDINSINQTERMEAAVSWYHQILGPYLQSKNMTIDDEVMQFYALILMNPNTYTILARDFPLGQGFFPSEFRQGYRSSQEMPSSPPMNIIEPQINYPNQVRIANFETSLDIILENTEIGLMIERYNNVGELQFNYQHNQNKLYPVGNMFNAMVGLFYYQNTPVSEWDDSEGSDVYNMLINNNEASTDNVLNFVGNRISGISSPIEKFNVFFGDLGLKKSEAYSLQEQTPINNETAKVNNYFTAEDMNRFMQIVTNPSNDSLINIRLRRMLGIDFNNNDFIGVIQLEGGGYYVITLISSEETEADVTTAIINISNFVASDSAAVNSAQNSTLSAEVEARIDMLSTGSFQSRGHFESHILNDVYYLLTVEEGAIYPRYAYGDRLPVSTEGNVYNEENQVRWWENVDYLNRFTKSHAVSLVKEILQSNLNIEEVLELEKGDLIYFENQIEGSTRFENMALYLGNGLIIIFDQGTARTVSLRNFLLEIYGDVIVAGLEIFVVKPERYINLLRTDRFYQEVNSEGVDLFSVDPDLFMSEVGVYGAPGAWGSIAFDENNLPIDSWKLGERVMEKTNELISIIGGNPERIIRRVDLIINSGRDIDGNLQYTPEIEERLRSIYNAALAEGCEELIRVSLSFNIPANWDADRILSEIDNIFSGRIENLPPSIFVHYNLSVTLDLELPAMGGTRFDGDDINRFNRRILNNWRTIQSTRHSEGIIPIFETDSFALPNLILYDFGGGTLVDNPSITDRNVRVINNGGLSPEMHSILIKKWERPSSIMLFNQLTSPHLRRAQVLDAMPTENYDLLRNSLDYLDQTLGVYVQ